MREIGPKIVSRDPFAQVAGHWVAVRGLGTWIFEVGISSRHSKSKKEARCRHAISNDVPSRTDNGFVGDRKPTRCTKVSFGLQCEAARLSSPIQFELAAIGQWTGVKCGYWAEAVDDKGVWAAWA